MEISSQEVFDLLKSAGFNLEIPELPALTPCQADSIGKLNAAEKIIWQAFLQNKRACCKNFFDYVLEKRLRVELDGRDWFVNGDLVIVTGQEACGGCPHFHACRF